MKKEKKLLCLGLSAFLLFPLPSNALQKKETIYENLNYKGENTKISVSNHLTFVDKKQIEDETKLKNILNIGGNETFISNGNQLTWNTNEKDIFYTGETTEQSPIRVNIRYFLNQEEKDLKEMIGSKGKIKIQMEFQNTDTHQDSINGKQKTLSTPFVTTVGTLLDAKDKDISVTNGKIVSTGSRNIVVALASPGLYESTRIEELKNLNTITLEFTTEKFELNNIYIVSTPKLLENHDLEIFDKMDSLHQNVSELQKKMNTLEAGILELAEGIKQIDHGSSELVQALKDASDGVSKLHSHSVNLEKGIKEISASLKKAKQELGKVDTNSIKSIETIIKQNQMTVQNLLKTAGLKEAELKALYEKQNLKNYTGTDETLKSLKSTYELIQLLNGNTTALKSTLQVITTYQQKCNTLIDSFLKAIHQVETGASAFTNGTKNLQTGIAKIYKGSKSLETGTAKLKKGSDSLVQGANLFNKQGIGTLYQYSNTLKDYSDTFEALMQLSENYHGFSSNNSDETIIVSKVESYKLIFGK